MNDKTIGDRIATFINRTLVTTAAAVGGAAMGVMLYRVLKDGSERLTPEQQQTHMVKYADWFAKWQERQRGHSLTDPDTIPTCATPECKAYGMGYMLTDEAWTAATGGDEKIHYLCIACVRKRLGRQLTIGDFVNFPINEPIFAALANVEGAP
jgi:hypothetical protein